MKAVCPDIGMKKNKHTSEDKLMTMSINIMIRLPLLVLQCDDFRVHSYKRNTEFQPWNLCVTVCDFFRKGPKNKP